jgi:hypothetical protein
MENIENENSEKTNIEISIEDAPKVDLIQNEEKNLEHEWNKLYKDSKTFKKSLNKPIKNFDEREMKFYKRLQKREQLQKKQEKEEKKTNEIKASLFDIEPEPEPEAKQLQIENQTPQSEEDIYIQLETLKTKFPDIGERIEFNKNMSMEVLRTKYKLYMTLIEQRHADSVAFNVFLLLNKAVERTAEGYFNIDCLNGLSDNVLEMKTEISEVLKEMVANGEIDTAMLTPQLRLMLIMSGVIVQTIEKNSAKKKALKEDVENVDVSGS